MFEINYKKLNVWLKSKELCIIVYNITRKFPKEELYCLTSQIRRACISIPSNIAEGYAKSSIKEKLKFVEIAIGSYYELSTQIEISHDLEYIINKDYIDFSFKFNELGKLLTGYKKSLQNKLKEKGSSSNEL